MSGSRETTTSNQAVAVRVVGRDDVEVISVSPSSVEVTLEEATTKEVPVQVIRQGAQPQGVAIASIGLAGISHPSPPSRTPV